MRCGLGSWFAAKIWSNRNILGLLSAEYVSVEREFLNSSPVLMAESSRCKQLPAAVVHPDLFAEVLVRPINARRLLKEMPTAMFRTISARTKRWLRK